MSAKKMRRERARAAALKPGQTVLLGSPGISMPGDWWFGRVEWSNAQWVLVQQYGIGGTTAHMCVHPVEMVRSVGDHAFLGAFKARCATEVKALRDGVREAEIALGAARDAVWARLDEIGAAFAQERDDKPQEAADA